MRILLSAFACHPHWGSEPGAGWSWTKSLASRHEVWVLTRSEYRSAIEEEGLPGVHFRYPSDALIRQLTRFGLPGSYLYFYLWQVKAWLLARRIVTVTHFDLIQHVTFATFKVPSFLCLLPIPFVFGSIAGGEEIPAALRRQMNLRLFDRVRPILNRLALYIPGVRMTLSHARAILVDTVETREFLPLRFREKCVIFNNQGLLAEELSRPCSQPSNEGRLLYCGLLEPRKGVEFLLRATALLDPALRWHLTILGDGSQRIFLARLAATLGLNSRVTFLGRVRHDDVAVHYASSDIFCFPSVRDGGGTVLKEALAAAVPIVCFDLGGPGQIVTPECGIKVVPGTFDGSVIAFSRALSNLLRDHDLRRRLSIGARDHAVNGLSWQSKLTHLHAIYEREGLIGGGSGSEIAHGSSPGESAGRSVS